MGTMYFPAGLLVLRTLYPLNRAWGASRGTSLTHALAWASGAWLAWLYLAIGPAIWGERVRVVEPARYVALCLTACAGVAVLGARRPALWAWNFVVLGLLVI